MKKNKKRINTSKVVIIFSLILIVVIVLYTSLNSGIFNSDNIEIEGNKYVESEYIIKALEVNNNKNIFRYNIKDMEEILLNNKYIDKVEIKRLLPNILKVSIIEKEIVANLYNEEIYCYIDKEGNFIDEIDENNKDNEVITVHIDYNKTDSQEIKFKNEENKKIDRSCYRIPYLCISNGSLFVTSQHGSRPDGEDSYGGRFLRHRTLALARAPEEGTNA